MRTRTIFIRDLSPSDEEAWRDLAKRSIEPNPFYEADFLVPASRHLRHGKGVALLVAEEAGRLHACLPVHPIKMLGIFSLPVITSWQNLYGGLGTPLVAPEHGVEAVKALLTALRNTGLWPRVVILEHIGDDGPIASYIRRSADELGLTVNAYRSVERGVFPCQDENINVQPKKQRQQWSRLCRELGDPSVVDRAKDGSTDFLAMEASGWKGTAGTALACRAGDAAFYQEVVDRFGASGRLHLYSLEVGDNKLAMSTNLIASDTLYAWKIAYSECFARHGPGALLQWKIFDLARQERMHWVDPCAEVATDHKLRLFPDRRHSVDLAIRKNGRIESRVLVFAVLLVQMSGKLRGLSAKTLRYKLVGTYRLIGRTFPVAARKHNM